MDWQGDMVNPKWLLKYWLVKSFSQVCLIVFDFGKSIFFVLFTNRSNTVDKSILEAFQVELKKFLKTQMWKKYKE